MNVDTLLAAAHGAVALLCLLLARRIWTLLVNVQAAAPHGEESPTERWGLPALILGYGALLLRDLSSGGTLHFGFALALSAMLWLTLTIVWIEGRFVPLRGLLPVVLAAAGVAVVLPLIFPGAPLPVERSLAFKLHLHAAVFAYGLLTIGALHALLMMGLDRRLHRADPAAAGDNRLFAHVPSLLAVERLMFRLIWVGFALLTLTVGSGLLFSEEVFGQPLRIEHKTVFALTSWLVFAGLLAGRIAFGWRGRVALRWTLAGFALLVLAYVGSRFVLEVILHRM